MTILALIGFISLGAIGATLLADAIASFSQMIVRG